MVPPGLPLEWLHDRPRASTKQPTPPPLNPELGFLSEAIDAALTAATPAEAALDLAERVRGAGERGRLALEHALDDVASDIDDADSVRWSVHRFVGGVHGLVDALGGALANDLVGVVAAAAGDAGRRRRVERRLRAAAALLRAATHPTLATLLKSSVEFDTGGDGVGAHVSVAAAVALGDATPPPPDAPSIHAPLIDRQRALVDAVERAVGAHSWGLGDCLVDGGCVPLRTRDFVRYVRGLQLVVDSALAVLAPSGAPEQRTAWALAAVVHTRRWSRPEFETFSHAARRLRAHEPPPRHLETPWLLTRALLGRGGHDARRIGVLTRSAVYRQEATMQLVDEAMARLATLAVATRTLLGAQWLASDAILANAALSSPGIDILLLSPSGTLEFTTHEIGGWVEWPDQASPPPPLAGALTAALLAALEDGDDGIATRAIAATCRFHVMGTFKVTQEWRRAMRAAQDPLEVSMRWRMGSLPFASDDVFQAATAARRFRRHAVRCLRGATAAHGLAVWMAGADQAVVSFARSFTTTPVDVVDAALQFERALRAAWASAGDDHRGALDEHTSMLLKQERHTPHTPLLPGDHRFVGL